jgi:hypothetical protein
MVSSAASWPNLFRPRGAVLAAVSSNSHTSRTSHRNQGVSEMSTHRTPRLRLLAAACLLAAPLSLAAAGVARAGTQDCNLIVPHPTCNGLLATICGTDGDDNIVGTAGDDVIVGLGGNDVIDGRGGNDTICGNEGDDILKGSNGDDVLIGGPGNDILRGGNGNDILVGGAGDDTLEGGGGNDRLNGGGGTDTCDGGLGTGDKARNCETVKRVP